MAVYERLKIWLDYRKSTYNETQTVIGARLGYKKAYFSALKNGKAKINLDVVQSLLNYDDRLDAGWLLIGRGNMYYDVKMIDANYQKNENDVSSVGNNANFSSNISVLKKVIEELIKQLNVKDDQIIFLQELIGGNKEK